MAINDNERVIREKQIESAVADAFEESEIQEEYRWDSTDNASRTIAAELVADQRAP